MARRIGAVTMARVLAPFDQAVLAAVLERDALVSVSAAPVGIPVGVSAVGISVCIRIAESIAQ